MAVAREWDRQIIPVVLLGVLGYSVGTFVPLALGHLVLKPR